MHTRRNKTPETKINKESNDNRMEEPNPRENETKASTDKYYRYSIHASEQSLVGISDGENTFCVFIC